MAFSCTNKQSGEKLDESVLFLKAIADKHRLRILCLLAGEGSTKGGCSVKISDRQTEKCVCEIIEFLKLPQNLVSHHLKVLKDAGLVDSRKEGLQVFYHLNQKNISNKMEFINSSIGLKTD